MPAEAKMGTFWCVYIPMGKMHVEAILGRFARSEVLREKRGHPSTSFQWGTIPQGDG